MTNKFYSSIDGIRIRVASVMHRCCHRSASVSFMSGQSLLTTLLLCLTLFIGTGQMWGAIYFEDTFSNVGNQDNQSVSSRSGWSNFSTCYSQGNSGLRVGSKNNGGSVKKTAMAGISGTKDLKVTVYVAKYSTNANTLTITCTNGTISGNSIVISPSGNAGVSGTTDAATWTDAYKTEFTITGASSSTTITFSSNKRVVLGPVKIEDAVASCDKKVTITKGTPETGGSFNLDKTGEQNCCNALTVTVSNITAPSGKQFGAITQSGINSGVTIDQNAKTVTYAANSSGSSTINVTFVDLPKYTVTLMDDNDTRTQASYSAAVSLPARAGCTGYTFAGWTKTWTSAQGSWTTTAPTIIPAGSYTPTADENLYPVYTKTEGGGTTYQFQKVTALSQIKAGGTFIITNGSYYLPNGAATNAGPAVASMVTVTNGVVTGTVTDAMKWTFSAADANNRTTIKSVANSNNYLYTVSDGNGVRVSTTSDSWTFEEYTVSSILGFAMKSTSQNRYCAVYSTSNWRSYTTKNAANYSQNSGRLDIYKYTEVSSSTTSYISVPNCCTPLVSINGSFNRYHLKIFHHIIMSMFVSLIFMC